jgi:hypothetical protein
VHIGAADDDTSVMVAKKVSLRMMLRASRRVAAYGDFYDAITSGIMARFMATPAR